MMSKIITEVLHKFNSLPKLQDNLGYSTYLLEFYIVRIIILTFLDSM